MNLKVPPPLQALICIGLIWLIARTLPEFSFSFPGQTIAAVFVAAIGVAIDVISLNFFMRAKTTVSPISPEKTTSLVTDGVYKYTRNPMYLGLTFILSGFAIWQGNLFGFVGVILFVGYVTRFQIIPEETILREKFGQEYEDYCSRTGRWL
ncbi:MAG: isoprenylcysteine carboxylmethyltransferase family protein [Pseudomonadota bacterium]